MGALEPMLCPSPSSPWDLSQSSGQQVLHKEQENKMLLKKFLWDAWRTRQESFGIHEVDYNKPTSGGCEELQLTKVTREAAYFGRAPEKAAHTWHMRNFAHQYGSQRSCVVRRQYSQHKHQLAAASHEAEVDITKPLWLQERDGQGRRERKVDSTNWVLEYACSGENG